MTAAASVEIVVVMVATATGSAGKVAMEGPAGLMVVAVATREVAALEATPESQRGAKVTATMGVAAA